MVRQKLYIGRNDINRLAVSIDGVRYDLSVISKIEFRILDLDLEIPNSVSANFPIKWELTPNDIGVIEYQIGTNEHLTIGLHKIDIFIYDATNIKGIYFNSFELNVKP